MRAISVKPPRGQIDTFWLPKAGSSDDEYEDAAANSVSDMLTTDFNQDVDEVLIAVADGATESLLSGPWARALAKRVVAEPLRHRRWADAIQLAIQDWPGQLDEYRRERSDRDKPIAWYEEPGLTRGADATLVALRIRKPMSGRPGYWWSVAVGDATLFHVRGDRCLRAFPLRRSTAFDTSPDLIRSLDTAGAYRRHFKKTQGEWLSADMFFLCTDALAAWFLQSCEHGEQPWDIWGDFGTQDCQAFESWVVEERGSGRLKNDDVTLVRVHCF